ncbi:restriction endonuclease subunit S [Phaeobacter gallaeciensis]|uniref:restriction endonuclease subunit S n=1 Tax=Phaeobacter gallaeciensis TaxID=60890 RepID=UPI000BBBB411|nr:restriction endonuclease subunit S [Phaeobacter gallaeciensis]ATF16812.1 Type I restriction modification DNA specificity domain protein [Phaeobacter gallaeciensis]ATF20921.1 Type I restriction modification DNA specificity domain protein [Phaeobacter gallaeciensis]
MNSAFISLPISGTFSQKRSRFLFRVRGEKAHEGDQQLAATQSHGVLSQKRYMEITGNKVVAALAGIENFNHVEKDDFVISLRTFEGGLERAKESGCISPAYTVLEPSKEVDPGYFQYLLKSKVFISHLQTTVTGIRDGKSVKFENLANIILPSPDLETQRQIAGFLDRETARIDLLIEKKRRLVVLLGEKYFANLECMTFPQDLPGDELVPFRWICRIAEGQVDPTSDTWRGRILIAPNHIESKTGRLLAMETAEEQGAISGKYAFGKGTVLYSKIRPALAKACISPSAGMCSADMYPIIPDKRLRPEYLLMQLLSSRFTDWATLESMRVAMPKINRETLGGFRLRVPPLGLQDDYVRTFAAKRSRFESVADKIRSSIERIMEYRSALITAAVTGQIDVQTYGKSGTVDRRLDAIQEEMEA